MDWGYSEMPEPVLKHRDQTGSAIVGGVSSLADFANAVMGNIQRSQESQAKLEMARAALGLDRQKAQNEHEYQQGMLGYHKQSLDNAALAQDRLSRMAAAKAALQQGVENASPITGSLKDFGPDTREPEAIGETTKWEAAAADARQGKPNYLSDAGGLSQASMPDLSLQQPSIATKSPGAQAALSDAFGSGDVGQDTSTLNPGTLQMPPVAVAAPAEPVSPQDFATARGPVMANDVAMARARQAMEKASGRQPALTFEQRAQLKNLDAMNRAKYGEITAGSAGLENRAVLPQTMRDLAEQGVQQQKQALGARASELAQNLPPSIRPRQAGPVQQPLPLKPPGNMNRGQAIQWAKANGWTPQQTQALVSSLPR